MNDLLFDVPESKSPRLLWMEKHGFKAHRFQPGETVCGIIWSGCAAAVPFCDEVKECHILDLLEIWSRAPRLFAVGHGETEAEAVEACARELKIPLWNEEVAP